MSTTTPRTISSGSGAPRAAAATSATTARSSTSARPKKKAQWGRRSRITSSPSFSRRRGKATAGAYRRCPVHSRAARRPSGPAELVEAVVVDAEVVGHLVDHGDAHLLDHLGLGGAPPEDRLPVDGDAVGEREAPVVGA